MRTPDRAREVTDEVAASGADIGVVVAFGQILPESLFTAVPLGFVNVHFSLLPRWRGAAPVERAILAGDAETGVCIMEIEKGLDTGAVYARAATPIDDEETAGELRERLVALGTDLLVDTLPNIASITPTAAGGGAHVGRQADRRRVRARLHAAAGRARPRRPRRQPAPGRVDHRRRAAAQGLARPRGRRRVVGAPRSAARGEGAHVERRVDARPAGRAGPVRLVTSSRLVALDALVRIEDGAYAQVLLPSMLRDSNLRDRDRAFTTDLVYGTVRAQRRLDDLVTRAAKRPLHRLDPPVRAALRLGAYQLLHDVPRHAAVSETVDALGGAFAAGARLRQRGVARAHAARPAVARTVDRRGRALVPRLDRRAARP